MRLPGRAVSPSLSTPEREVAAIEALPCKDGDRFLLRFETSSGDWRHGVWLAVQDGHLTVGDVSSPQVTLWQDTAPQEVQLDVSGSDGLLRFYNVWERAGGGRQSQSFNCGLTREVVEGGYRFHCSDKGVDPDFTHLVFTLVAA
jgi:hypothetical protein